uniref:Uncharacterized protein n=1 Tax=Heterorhabditis bacteriophora TaxID=37862 RepID=A0A1I7WE01_HETBA
MVNRNLFLIFSIAVYKTFLSINKFTFCLLNFISILIMPKKFTVDGRELICVNQNDFDDVCEMFKENATGDSLQEWQTSVRFLDNFLRLSSK